MTEYVTKYFGLEVMGFFTEPVRDSVVIAGQVAPVCGFTVIVAVDEPFAVPVGVDDAEGKMAQTAIDRTHAGWMTGAHPTLSRFEGRRSIDVLWDDPDMAGLSDGLDGEHEAAIHIQGRQVSFDWSVADVFALIERHQIEDDQIEWETGLMWLPIVHDSTRPPVYKIIVPEDYL